MRCADFRVFSLRVQGPQPLPKEVRNPWWVPYTIDSYRFGVAAGIGEHCIGINCATS